MSTLLHLPATHRFPVGTLVGSRRWPWHGCHPDCWGRPWAGVVLRQDDPRAWTGTLRFPCAPPTQEETTAHVEWCRRTFGPPTHVPVLWDFGPNDHRVYFESADSLRPYDVDVAEWEAELAAARAACGPALARAYEGA